MHTFLISMILNKLMAAFSWMLMHSLWQGLLLAVVTAVLLALTKRWTAAARYNLVLVLCAGFLFICMYTFIWEWNHVYDGTTTATFATALGTRVSQLFFGNLEHVKQLLYTVTAYFSAHEQFIATLWMLIFGAKIIKMLVALLYNQRIKNRQVATPAVHWKHALSRLCETLQIGKPVALLESGYMKMPVVVGHINPVILMPLGLLTSLPADQVEAILLHELAHIRRNDYLANIFQCMAENIFFFNPAVLWISSWLREERENCCDDIALGQTQNKQGLVKALISFKQHELYGAAYSTAFPNKKDHLLRKTNHILENTDTSSTLPGKLFLLIAFILLFAGAGALMLVSAREPSKIKFSTTTSVTAVTRQKIVVTPASKPATGKAVPQKMITTKKINKIINTIEKTIAIKQAVTPVTAIPGKKQPVLSNEQMAARGRERAMEGQAHAKLEQEQALRDQELAMRDQQQALLNQEQAKRDQLQAMKAQEKAGIDQQQALKYKKEAEQKLQNQSFF